MTNSKLKLSTIEDNFHKMISTVNVHSNSELISPSNEKQKLVTNVKKTKQSDYQAHATIGST